MPDPTNPKSRIAPDPPAQLVPAEQAYAELQVTTNFSLLRGASHADELVFRAAELGYRAIACTDRNTLAGVVRMHEAATKCGLKLIVGVRLVLNDCPDVLLWAADRPAYARLCVLLTTGKRRAEKGHCALWLVDLLAALSDAPGLLAALVPPEPLDDQVEFILARLHGAVGGGAAGGANADRLSIATSCLYHGTETGRLRDLMDLSRATGIPLVATNDVHYHEPGRRALQDVITCVRHICTVHDAGYRLFPNGERYLKSPEQMHHVFAALPGAVRRCVQIAERCTFTLDELRYEYPHELVPPGMTITQHLRNLTESGIASRYPQGVPPKVRAQIEHELKLIEQLRYEAYFLTVHDLVVFARSRGILCQGRGSAANSAVCYCLGVTSVDPAQIDLLFERFVSAARKEPPDIDVDFEHERREEVIQYVYQKYGRQRAGMTAEVITYRGRSAVRDVGKALGLSLDLVDQMAKQLDGWHAGSMKEEQLRALNLDPNDRTIRQVVELTGQLLGFPRHLGQHVGGLIMTQTPLCEMVPIDNAVMADRTVIEWDKDDIDTVGMLKVDVLALGMLTCISKAFGMIAGRQHSGIHHGGTEARRATLRPAAFPHHRLEENAKARRREEDAKGKADVEEAAAAFTPSPGTPGEGWGEGSDERMKDEGGRMKAEETPPTVAPVSAIAPLEAQRVILRYSEGSGTEGELAHELSGLSTADRMRSAFSSIDERSFGVPQDDSCRSDISNAESSSFRLHPSSFSHCPHPNPLPAYRERGPEDPSRPLRAFVSSCSLRPADTEEPRDEELPSVPPCLRGESLSPRRPELHQFIPTDPVVYDMICRADTIGVFQIESRAQMSMLPRLRPRCFYDLVIEVAIVRPGPIQGNMVHPYLRRRNGEEEVTYPSEALREVLKKTLGVPLFQEQAMKVAMVAAGFSADEADQLRKAMAAWRKTAKLEEFRGKIINGMLERGYTRQFAEQTFDQIRGFGEYGFPESHAASFSLLVYVSCWLKRYHPAAFAAALINSQPMGFYAPAQIIRDAKEHGVKVLAIDVNESEWDCLLETEEGVHHGGTEARRTDRENAKARRREEDAKEKADVADPAAASAPSPGTPGEGWGEGSDERMKDEGGRMKGEEAPTAVGPVDMPPVILRYAEGSGTEGEAMDESGGRSTADRSHGMSMPVGARSFGVPQDDNSESEISNPQIPNSESSSFIPHPSSFPYCPHPSPLPAYREREQEPASASKPELASVPASGAADLYSPSHPLHAFAPSRSLPAADPNSHPSTWGVGGPAIRLGFRMVKGLNAAHALKLVEERRANGPFRSVREVRLRTGIPKPALQRLAEADAFGSMGLARREALWQVLGLEAEEAPLFEQWERKEMLESRRNEECGTKDEEPGTEQLHPEHSSSSVLRSSSFVQSTSSGLPPMPIGQEVMTDYTVFGLSLKSHPVGLIRGELQARKVITAAELREQRHGKWVRVAGLVLIRQRPGTASGIVFETLEDETGITNLIVRPKVYDQYKQAARYAMLVEAQGIVERQGDVVHVMVKKMEDLTWMVEGLQSRSRDFR